MFNIQPGQGIGRATSRIMAFGLGAVEIGEAIIRHLETFYATIHQFTFWVDEDEIP